ncbi:amidoligase family protein [Clostridium sp.]|uniref:amidoligase family protein n=1 Tax=Clostridium sp. TaxID=1506 RepID=UPI003216F9B2
MEWWREVTLGIEVEFTGITRNAAGRVLSKFFDSELLHDGGTYDGYSVIDDKGRKWKIVSDASIFAQKNANGTVELASKLYSCELVSPILYYSDIDELQELIRKLRKANAFVNSSCGIHIHVGAEELDAVHLKFLCNIMYSKQNLIYRSLNINSGRLRYCNKLQRDFIEELNLKKPSNMDEIADIWYGDSFSNRGAHYHSSRYRCLNLHNLLSGRQPTIEFRMFNSTLHAGKIKAYLQFCLLMGYQALISKKTSYKITVPVTGNDKYTFRVWLLRLGLIGDEFKTARYHLLKNLEGNIAWRDII